MHTIRVGTLLLTLAMLILPAIAAGDAMACDCDSNPGDPLNCGPSGPCWLVWGFSDVPTCLAAFPNGKSCTTVSVPEMSDYLAITFFVMAGSMGLLIRRKLI